MTKPVVAAKVAVVAPAATVTQAGMVRTVLVLDSVTAAPALGAATDKVMVHVEVARGAKVVGEH
jgi:hypothetical protein